MTTDSETQDAKPEGKDGKPEDDITKLKSTYDSQIATQNQEIKNLSQQLSDSELRVQALMEQVEGAKAAIELDEDASPETKAAVKKLEDELSNTTKGLRVTFAHWTDAASLAEARALALEFDVPDQVDSLAREFKKVATAEGKRGLDLAVKEKRVNLKTEAVEKKGKEKGKPEDGERRYDENVQSGRASPNAVDRMNEIDVTTPAGKAEWDKERGNLAKQVGVPLP